MASMETASVPATPSSVILIAALIIAALITGARGEQEFEDTFWSPRCSAVGVSVAFSSPFSLMFYVALGGVAVSLLAGAYHACFRMFTKDMFRVDW
ncbi:gN [anatid alphaherpesvirus 1]|uniref:Envelope glycoprotein n=1 Tax=anatid alphaherpesvirus 1 TaxID=104388 RepID=A4ZX81_9ALPH|nr:UL49.5 [Anatid alphaherpesvirus 1]YP_010795324.1 gN [Anatid alphaherpesvirus 1]AHD45930.1 UL49.5 [BAC cloning vector pDEV-vac]QWQ49759.1 UL49.5 [BAC cloning vector pDEV-CHa]ABP65276.1 envelope protein [Anatid alphaherpesvirus 1]ABY73934.1 envelope glycoprotein [Anatid alphaherpesvirus 1]ACT83531.1 UL49.5 [Anatid alphaherpesvirus 1]